jgi:protein-disulfide isomerase
VLLVSTKGLHYCDAIAQTSAALLVACALCVGTTHTAFAGDTAGSQAIVGVIGQQNLTADAVVKSDAVEFQRLDDDYERNRHKLEQKYTQSRYELLQKQLDRLLDHDALDAEAKARGVAPADVLRELKVDTVVTDAQAHAFYDANTDRVSQPFAQVAAQVREYLVTQRTEAAVRSFYDGLRAKHGITSKLAPYRMVVATTGPSRGQSDAPVTIVEFADFQCPYCKQAETSVRTVMSRYPTQVRLVFRHLPLTQIHPNAQVAAQAAVCAERQGKFWQMHDALYADQAALTRVALDGTARHLGLDAQRFTACMSDAATAATIAADKKAADDLGISGTPYFFVNGRPIDGSVPVEQYQDIVDSELKRAKGSADGQPTFH